MYTAVIKLTEAQASLIDQVVAKSPWYFHQAKGCSFDFLQGEESELEFQFELREQRTEGNYVILDDKYGASDEARLVEITHAAQKLGWPLRTCDAIRTKVKRAARRMSKYHQEKASHAKKS